jgi:FAD/FMN-containing dehydrogenase
MNSGSVERVSFFDGQGEAIMTGGYSSRNLIGPDLSSVLFGTDNSFGVPFEIMLKIKNKEEVNTRYIGVTYTDNNDKWMQLSKEDRETSLFFNMFDKLPTKYTDRSNGFTQVKLEFHNSIQGDVRAEIFKLKEKAGLKYDFVHMTDAINGRSHVNLFYKNLKGNQGGIELDRLTSYVIKMGGSVSAPNREEYNKISPYLFERLAGRHGLKQMQGLKELYDPNNILNRDALFNLTKIRSMGPIEHIRKENKQLNFLLNKFGAGI